MGLFLVSDGLIQGSFSTQKRYLDKIIKNFKNEHFCQKVEFYETCMVADHYT